MTGDYVLRMDRARANALAERRAGVRTRSTRSGERSQTRLNLARERLDQSFAAMSAMSAVTLGAKSCAD